MHHFKLIPEAKRLDLETGGEDLDAVNRPVVVFVVEENPLFHGYLLVGVANVNEAKEPVGQLGRGQRGERAERSRLAVSVEDQRAYACALVVFNSATKNTSSLSELLE